MANSEMPDLMPPDPYLLFALRGIHLDNCLAIGYDITSLDTQSGRLRLIEIKGIGHESGTVCLTPNEKRVTKYGRDCDWLSVVTHCNTQPRLHEPIKDLAWASIHVVLVVGAMGRIENKWQKGCLDERRAGAFTVFPHPVEELAELCLLRCRCREPRVPCGTECCRQVQFA